MPLGTSIETSQEVIDSVDGFVAEQYFDTDSGRVRNWLTFIGEGGPRFMLSLNPPNPNPATGVKLPLLLKPLSPSSMIATPAGCGALTRPSMSKS